MATRFDAVIVGARCAGAATALVLARAGARVLVVDRGVYGSDTLSTHALMRGAVLQLDRWGVLPAVIAGGTPPVRTTTFSYADQDVTVAIEPRHGVSALYAPRRFLLDRLLVDAAREAGAEVEHGVRVEDVRMDDQGRVAGVISDRFGPVEAGIVIGADGLHSTIARRVGAPPVVEGRHATGVLYTYWEGLESDAFFWGFRREAGVGVIPTNDGASCVFIAVPTGRFHDEVRGDALAAYHRFIRQAMPDLDARLAGARRVEPIRGFGGHRGCIRRSSGPGWALVGDAAYFKDPLTAHGITDALRDAELLARAIIAGTTEALLTCETTRLDLSKGLFEVTDEIVSFARTDAELQELHRALSAEMSREVRALAGLDPLVVGAARHRASDAT
jgi:flavin-dependent dehydrogenase